MIISDSHKFVFIHNPKCAGTSIRTCLESFDSYNFHFSGYRIIGNKLYGMMHLPLSVIQIHYPDILENKIRKYYGFTVVRNPYTRTVSAFNMVFEHRFIEYSETRNLDDYKEALNSFIHTSLEKDKILDYDYTLRHFSIQSDYVFLNGEKIIDSIFKFENIPQDFDRMKWMNTVLAYKLQNNLKMLNQREVNDNNTIELLDRRSLDIINEIYEKDFINFGYPI